jgi:UDP-N-acetylglucosamine--N-acetylmuramyl-(pentapeptide) pyrophosphoryl-undecaprenol N-acetylglucosamine transferase
LAVKTAALVSGEIQFLIAAGRKNADALKAAGTPSNVEIVSFLDSADLCRAYQSATLVLGRSGGTLAELAMFGLPSILIPLPSSADNHQLVNAQEFSAMHAATILWPIDAPTLPELTEASPANAAQAIDEWMNDPTGISNASHNLKDWDIPDATQRIWGYLTSAVR